MSSKKKYKVIVVGLPKTGTSTLAVMLRMLNYSVTGPDIKYNFGDETYLDKIFNEFDGFQDYPWCFEWQRFLKQDNTKFIILKRNRLSWVKSFYESYGRQGENYLSYPYMNLSKISGIEDEFLDYYDNYYKTAFNISHEYPNRFLEISLKAFDWKDLCDFLEEKQPTNIFGKKVKKPHVNKKNYLKNKGSILYRFKRKIQEIVGKERWNKLVIFLRKNDIVN